MASIKQKTNKIIEILQDTYTLNPKRAEISAKADGWEIEMQKFLDEKIYFDEAVGIARKLGEEAGFRISSSTLWPAPVNGIPRRLIIKPTGSFKIKDILDKLSRQDSLAEKVQKLTCIRQPDTKRYLIIVNNVAEKAIEVDGAQPTWELLLKIADGEHIKMHTQYKSAIDYLNNNKNNKIYTKTGLALSKILRVSGSEVLANIPITTQSQKARATRLNKLKAT